VVAGRGGAVLPGLAGLIALLSLGALRRARAGLALVLLAASLALAQVLVAGGGGVAAFFHLPARAWEFLAGGILALGLVRPPGDPARPTWRRPAAFWPSPGAWSR
jgi:peptidoglycan/LPS O-acetylase OafA/YrhL